MLIGCLRQCLQTGRRLLLAFTAQLMVGSISLPTLARLGLKYDLLVTLIKIGLIPQCPVMGRLFSLALPAVAYTYQLIQEQVGAKYDLLAM